MPCFAHAQAKDTAAGLGSVSGDASGAAALSGATSFNLVLRKEQSVQEVAVVATCTREELRQLAAASIAALAAAEAEPEPAAA